MAVTKVQNKNNTNASSSVGATFTSSPTQYNAIVACVWANVARASVSMSGSGWSTANQCSINTDSSSGSMFYKIAGASESSTVTANGTGATNMMIHIFELTGVDVNTPLDRTAQTSDVATNTSVSTGTTATTRRGGEFALAACFQGNTNGGLISWSNSFLEELSDNRILTASRAATSLATYESTATWTTSRNPGGIIGTFQPPLGSVRRIVAFQAVQTAATW